jgi:hypothetical protein
MPTPRRFTLLDAMIVVATVALALAATRWKYAGFAWFWGLDREGWTPGAVLRRTVTVAAFALPGLFAATLAVVLARLARPRPPLRRVALQPGSAACATALLAIAAEAVAYAARQAYYWLGRGKFLEDFRRWLDYMGVLGAFTTEVLIRSTYAVGYAVAATWVVLALGRRCRPERSWIDRAGRAVAVAWIVTAFLFWLDRNFLGGRDIPGSLGSPY